MYYFHLSGFPVWGVRLQASFLQVYNDYYDRAITFYLSKFCTDNYETSYIYNEKTGFFFNQNEPVYRFIGWRTYVYT